MSEDEVKEEAPAEPSTQPKKRGQTDGIVRQKKWYFALPTIVWVVASFFIASFGVGYLIALGPLIGLNPKNADTNVLLTFATAAIYLAMIALTLGGPRLIKSWSSKISYRKLLGLERLLRFKDIFVALLGFVVYLALGVGLILLVSSAVPGFNPEQTQDIGFGRTLSPNSAVLVFLALVVVAPVAEEILFRGYLFGTLRRSVPVWAAALLTSIVFGAIHGQWNVGLDVFVMSLVSCFLRYRTGSLWASMLLHMFKNGLAFYTLYIAGNAFL